MKISNKRVLVYGLSKTGIATINFLKSKNAIIYVYDDFKNLKDYVDYKTVFPFSELMIKKHYFDYIIISPGVPQNNRIITNAKKNKVKIISEVELAYRFCKSKNIIAVTGTNGKTTVTELISKVISSSFNCYMCGNIGIPFISKVNEIKKDDYVVLELSSFQLEAIKRFRPKIALILNLKPDHLNRYNNVNDYYKTKLNIIKNQKHNDYLIVNGEDNNIENLIHKTKPKQLWFGLQNKNYNGYIENGEYAIRIRWNYEKLFYTEEVKLIGEHNKSNILATLLVAKILKISNEKVKRVIINFNSIEHRLEFVKNIDGVDYVNDSKATNIDSTLNALLAFKNRNIKLLIGGSDKGENFETLFKQLSSNVFCYIYGETKSKMMVSALNIGYCNYKIYNKLIDALKDIRSDVQAFDVVLLSPACASFDEFNNYEERGEFFKQWVNNNV